MDDRMDITYTATLAKAYSQRDRATACSEATEQVDGDNLG